MSGFRKSCTFDCWINEDLAGRVALQQSRGIGFINLNQKLVYGIFCKVKFCCKKVLGSATNCAVKRACCSFVCVTGVTSKKRKEQTQQHQGPPQLRQVTSNFCHAGAVNRPGCKFASIYIYVLLAGEVFFNHFLGLLRSLLGRER